jgi:competence ComEA-like helix-hairpin-helix protein
MPKSERRALLLLLGLAVAGHGVRYILTKPGEAPGGVQLMATLGSGSPLAQRDSAMRQGRPLAEGEQIDVDRAPAGELARLPKVGPRLAKTIVADRQAHGPFGRLEGLDRVPGIGAGLLQAVGPHVVFSGTGHPGGTGALVPSSPCLPATAPLPRCPAVQLDINTATLTELDALPGIGPAKARAIIGYREEHGRFTSVEGLAAVPGLTRAVLVRLREKVVAR